MTDYRIEAATKEEWAERALRAEAKLAKALEALGEIATDEHPLGWIALTALIEQMETFP